MGQEPRLCHCSPNNYSGSDRDFRLSKEKKQKKCNDIDSTVVTVASIPPHSKLFVERDLLRQVFVVDLFLTPQDLDPLLKAQILSHRSLSDLRDQICAHYLDLKVSDLNIDSQ